MAKPKPLDEEFVSSWNQAVAWAQTQHIAMPVIQDVYQQDLTRLKSGGYPMSQAERSRALLAASNPNDVTPVPSDHPSPASLFGNARNDLRSIFTGLAPNHLVPNIFHTLADVVIHPNTWIDPIEDVAGGIATGNLSDIRKGLELAGGQNSILSWLPGVYDLSELAQGGWQNVLDHPIVSLLDIAPFAPAGKLLSLAADDARISTIAKGLGMTSEDLRKASVPKLASSWLLAKDFASRDPATGAWVARFPGSGRLTQVMTDAKGKPLTVGAVLRNMGDAHPGISRTAAFLMGSAFDLRGYGTDADIYVNRPLALAVKDLTADQQNELHHLMDRTDPRAQGKTPTEVMSDSAIDQKVRTAYSAMQDANAVGISRAWASGGLVQLEGPDFVGPDGKMTHDAEVFSAVDQDNDVVTAARAYREKMSTVLERLGPEHGISKQIQEVDKAAGIFVDQMEKSRQQALEVGQKTMNQMSRDVRFSKTGKVLESVTLDVSRQAALVFGENGVIARVADALSTVDGEGRPKDMDFETAKALIVQAKKALDHDGYGSLNAGRDPAYMAVVQQLDRLGPYVAKRISDERGFLKRLTRDRPKGLGGALRDAVKAYRDFEKAWWKTPPDRWRSALYDKEIDEILKRYAGAENIARASQRLRELDMPQRQIDEMLSDHRRLAEFIWHDSEAAVANVGSARILTQADMTDIYTRAMDEVNRLREEGHEVTYIPVVSTHDLVENTPGRYGVGVARDARVRELASTRAKTMRGFMPERYDVLAAVTMAAKAAIQRDVTIEFVESHLTPKIMTSDEVADWAIRAFPDEYANRLPQARDQADLTAELVAGRLGLVAFDPAGKFGFSFPRWSQKTTFLPKVYEAAITKMLDKGVFPLDGVFDKATNLFRFSILALSPRYTAHIVFGGFFLLLLRSDPRILTKWREAYRMTKDGRLPPEIRGRATEIGKAEIAPVTFEDKLRRSGLDAYHTAAGSQLAYLSVQEELAAQGIDWKKARPDQWLKAIGDVNYKFTNGVATMYRAMAFLDYSDKATARGEFFDPETGERLKMTPQRAKYEGIQHALKVMGNLKAMTPLERSIFTKVFPFYGWQRHILTYVATYPVDHPVRAQFLTVASEQDSDSVASAFDKRLLFLFFLGSPDSSGNVSAIDVRFLDPLRDVANYATWGGWISALNPVLSAPLAMIDPNLIYGSTALYPNVTFDQFYGIETTGTQGSALSGLEQFVPQVTALDAALQTAGQYRQLGQKNPNAFYKTIFEALNIPFFQKQKINLPELAAKGELARYDVAKAAAANAFDTGDFSGLAGFASVPNPLNPDYEITPQQLEAVYNQALATYPGLPPSEILSPPPPPPGL